MKKICNMQNKSQLIFHSLAKATTKWLLFYSMTEIVKTTDVPPS